MPCSTVQSDGRSRFTQPSGRRRPQQGCRPSAFAETGQLESSAVAQLSARFTKRRDATRQDATQNTHRHRSASLSRLPKHIDRRRRAIKPLQIGTFPTGAPLQIVHSSRRSPSGSGEPIVWPDLGGLIKPGSGFSDRAWTRRRGTSALGGVRLGHPRAAWITGERPGRANGMVDGPASWNLGQPAPQCTILAAIARCRRTR
jgi:hypothetical protein